MQIRGTAKWFKATGKPTPAYQNTHDEWSFDLGLDDETAARLKKENFNVKDKEDGPYLTFKRREFNKEGNPNQPIRIVDHKNNVLQDKDTVYTGPKIGNGSILNVNFNSYEYTKGKNTPVVLSVQIWELVEYAGEFPVRDDPEGDWEKDAA